MVFEPIAPILSRERERERLKTKYTRTVIPYATTQRKRTAILKTRQTNVRVTSTPQKQKQPTDLTTCITPEPQDLERRMRSTSPPEKTILSYCPTVSSFNSTVSGSAKTHCDWKLTSVPSTMDSYGPGGLQFSNTTNKKTINWEQPLWVRVEENDLILPEEAPDSEWEEVGAV